MSKRKKVVEPHTMTIREVVEALSGLDLPPDAPVVYLTSYFDEDLVTLSVYEDDGKAIIDVGYLND